MKKNYDNNIKYFFPLPQKTYLTTPHSTSHGSLETFSYKYLFSAKENIEIKAPNIVFIHRMPKFMKQFVRFTYLTTNLQCPKY